MPYGRRIFWLAAIPVIVSIPIATLAPAPHGHWLHGLTSEGGLRRSGGAIVPGPPSHAAG